MNTNPLTIHATALILGETGFLLRGKPGAGKSSLAFDLIAHAQSCGYFARLVADDRVQLTALSGRLIATPHPVISGLIELRSIGIVPVEHEPACIIRGVLDLTDDVQRIPNNSDRMIELLGIKVYCLQVNRHCLSTARLFNVLSIGLFNHCICS